MHILSFRCFRLAVLLVVALSAACSWAGSYMTVKATVPSGQTGSGKVYAQWVEAGGNAPEAPEATSYLESFEKREDSKNSDGSDDGRRFDVYYYALADESSKFSGWYSDESLTTLVSTDNPYVWQNHGYSNADRWAKFESAVELYEGPEDFTGEDAEDPTDWFRTANWSEAAVPTYTEITPRIPAGKHAVFDAQNAAGGKDSAVGDLFLGSSGGETPGELTLTSGLLSAKHIYIGRDSDSVETGGCGRLVQNGGQLAIRDGMFYIGYAAGSEWSEYVMNGGTCSGASTDTGLVVGNNGKGRFILTGGTYTQSGDVHVSRLAGSQGEVYVRGGTFELRENSYIGNYFDNPLKLGEGAYAYLEVSGVDAEHQGLLDFEDGLRIGNGSVAKILTNGVAYVNYIWDWGGNRSGTLVLDGGTVRYRGGRRNKENNNLNFINGLSAILLGEGGATLDDSGQTVVVYTPITADPALDGEDCGQIVKRGSGTLVLPALGDGVSVLVEEGAVGISADNAFTASQLAFPEESSGTCAIDLYGHELEWSDFTKVTEFRNTAAVQATLVVDCDSDVDLSRMKFSGDIKVVKRGAGRLSLNGTAVSAIAVDEGALAASVGYRYYRVKCDSLKGWCGYADGWAMGEMELYSGDAKLAVTADMLSWDTETTYNGATHRDGCTPDSLFDGDYETYMMDVRAHSTGKDYEFYYEAIDACWFTIDFGRLVQVTGYAWYRGPDATKKQTVDGYFYNGNDPTRLRIYASYDGENWIELSNEGFASDDASSASRSTNETPVLGGSAFIAEADVVCSSVSVADGASLSVEGADVRVGALDVEEGAIVDLHGGRFVFDEDESEIKGLVNSPIAVKGGVAAVGGLWYRFTILRVGWNHLSPLLAELLLYDADGNRLNSGLFDCGDGVAPTDMPYGSCSQAEAYGHADNEGPEKLFDGRQTASDSTLWHPNRGVNDDWSSPVVLTMRLAPGSPLAAAHALVVHKGVMDGADNYWNTPHIWKLEVSSDGENWTDVYSRDTMFPDSELADYKEIVFDNNPVELSWPNAFGADFSVGVDEGASLIVSGAGSAIPTLVYDYAAGCGTIDGFNPAPNGTLRIVNVPDDVRPMGDLGYTVLNAVNTSNLKSWRVFVNGAERSLRLRLVDGVLSLSPGYMKITIR